MNGDYNAPPSRTCRRVWCTRRAGARPGTDPTCPAQRPAPSPPLRSTACAARAAPTANTAPRLPPPTPSGTYNADSVRIHVMSLHPSLTRPKQRLATPRSAHAVGTWQRRQCSLQPTPVTSRPARKEQVRATHYTPFATPKTSPQHHLGPRLTIGWGYRHKPPDGAADGPWDIPRDAGVPAPA